jgi:hypothetical protein
MAKFAASKERLLIALDITREAITRFATVDCWKQAAKKHIIGKVYMEDSFHPSAPAYLVKNMLANKIIKRFSTPKFAGEPHFQADLQIRVSPLLQVLVKNGYIVQTKEPDTGQTNIKVIAFCMMEDGYKILNHQQPQLPKIPTPYHSIQVVDYGDFVYLLPKTYGLIPLSDYKPNFDCKTAESSITTLEIVNELSKVIPNLKHVLIIDTSCSVFTPSIIKKLFKDMPPGSTPHRHRETGLLKKIEWDKVKDEQKYYKEIQTQLEKILPKTLFTGAGKKTKKRQSRYEGGYSRSRQIKRRAGRNERRRKIK